MIQKYLVFYYLIIILLSISICVFFLPIILQENNLIFLPQTNFVWPTPNYYTITSNYGHRKAPTAGASTFHSGIDIGAPEGSKIVSICDGYVTFTGFKGAGGFTITISSPPYQISYCHVNPNFEVSVSEFISKGEQISKVGPKYVENVPNNSYKDSSGKFTNGASTGPHLHLTIKKDNITINPLTFFPNLEK